MNGLISLCLLVVVGCVSAELSQFGPRRPSNRPASKESAEKPNLSNGGALVKPQNGAAQAAGQPARASSATSRPNRLPAKKRSRHPSAKLTASAQPGLSQVNKVNNNSTLSQSSEEVHSVKEREHSHGKTQHGSHHHSKGKAGSLGQPARHAKRSAAPSAGPALPPSPSNSTNKTNGSSVATGKHSSEESSEEGDSHSSEESAKKHRPSKSDGGHSHKDSGSSSSESDEHKSRPHTAGHSQDGADTKLTQAILKQILKGEPVKVKVEKKAKIFFEREKRAIAAAAAAARKRSPILALTKHNLMLLQKFTFTESTTSTDPTLTSSPAVSFLLWFVPTVI